MNEFRYPPLEIDVLSFDAFETIHVHPPGVIPTWPPPQTNYLQAYLEEISCKSVILENHYIDHAFLHDDMAYYVRSLRSYPNFTKRAHFFSELFDDVYWRELIDRARHGEFSEIQEFLQSSYLGFSIVRPLPQFPVGRTVLPAKTTREPQETRSSFHAIRRHRVHLAGFSLHVEGVPFQSQDQGVSACATTALWSALDGIAATEEITVSPPASITRSATRYPLQEGRRFPNEGLTVRQMCEATRAAGFSPLVVRSETPADDAMQIFSYALSGFAPVLTLLPADGEGEGHAVCCVGFRAGATKPQTNPAYKFREASSGLKGLYIHDDRLGPYAFAKFSPLTESESGKIRTRISIEWPDETPDCDWILHAIVIPIPQNLRLTVSRLRWLGPEIAQAIGDAFADSQTTLNCRFEVSRNYAKQAYTFDLSSEGLYKIVCGTALSRHIGLIEIASPKGPILDIVVDSTESNAESAVLACIKRSGFPNSQFEVLEVIANYLGVHPTY